MFIYILRGEIQKLPEDIKTLWSDKMKTILSAKGIDAEIDGEELSLNNKVGEDAIKIITTTDLTGVIDDLDNYQDYKRVVRAYQQTMQQLATKDKKDIVYDESGDEPDKIIKNMSKLDKANYITDVIMVHHKDMVNNLFQNASRMVQGHDGGRDSSDAIVGAYLDIQDGMDKYKDAAEVSVSTSTDQIQKGKGKAIDALSQANTADDAEMGNKPIDVFVRIYGSEPEDVLKRISKELDDEQLQVFKAILTYQVQEPSLRIPENTKDLSLGYIKMDNAEAMNILNQANNGELKGKYKHDQGGVNDKLVDKAKEVLI